MEKTRIKTKKMAASALFLALGMILPFFTGQVPVMGNMLLPMHLPVLFCGFLCGWEYGLIVGALLPLARGLFFGAPILFPTALAMAAELAVYGGCTGYLGRRLGRSTGGIYTALVSAMLAGRVVWGLAAVVLYRIAGSSFTWKVFLTKGFLDAVPGITIQLLLVPAVIKRIPPSWLLPLKSSCIERFAPAVSALRVLASKKDKDCILVAIDGKCASGKSTLGFYLKEVFDANLFHMDDFFLQKQQRTQKRLAEVGGNVDYERFAQEVLKPLLAGEAVVYRRFDCGSLTIADGQTIQPKRINIIEGSYSQHPYFGAPYDLKIFMEIDSKTQLENIRKRNGEEKLAVFQERWIPKEEAYFEKFAVKEHSDVRIAWKKGI